MAYCIAAVIGAAVPGSVAKVTRDAMGDPVKIHLVAGPIHYDFLLPLTDEARDALAPLSVTGIAIDDSTQAWALIGWGAR
ncbi:MAG: hypothetical protein AAFZ04_02980 [Pseudomonadota bacterium]